MIGQIIPESKWEIARIGKFTSSRIHELLTKPKSKEDKISATAMGYVNEKIAEITTGTIRAVDSPAIEWGNCNEPIASDILCKKYPGMTYHGKDNPRYFPLTTFSGGSPDTVHYDEYIVGEIKCPENPANHIKYCLINTSEGLKKVSKQYYYQIQMNMLVVAKDLNVDFFQMRGVFASYYPHIHEEFKNFHSFEINPDPEFFKEIYSAISIAETELAEGVDLIRSVA